MQMLKIYFISLLKTVGKTADYRISLTLRTLVESEQFAHATSIYYITDSCNICVVYSVYHLQRNKEPYCNFVIPSKCLLTDELKFDC